jgi:hypothetical protein
MVKSLPSHALSGPPLYLRTKCNALEGVSSRLDVLVCSVGKGKRKGATTLPGTMSAISLSLNNQLVPAVQKCRAVSNPFMFAWHSCASASPSIDSSLIQDYLLVADENTVELWKVVVDSKKEGDLRDLRFQNCVVVPIPKPTSTTTTTATATATNSIGISSVHWRPTASKSTKSFMVVTKHTSLIFTVVNDTDIKGPVCQIKVPVPGTTSVCSWHDHSTLALCGGGEFSLHNVSDSTKGVTSSNQCLCVDLSMVDNSNDAVNTESSQMRNGAPRSLCTMSSSHKGGTNTRSDLTVLFACLTDTPVVLPFESGKRDRPLNEAIHMLRSARSKQKKKDQQDDDNNNTNTAGIPTVKMDLSPLLMLEKSKSSLSSSSSSLVVMEELEKKEDDIIDLVGKALGNDGNVWNSGNGGFNNSGGRGSTLDALMSISKNRRSGATGSMLNVVNGRAGSSSALPSPDTKGRRTRTSTPTLSVYAAHNSKSIMRVYAIPVPLLHGDVMACSPDNQLIAVSSNTCNKVHIYEYSHNYHDGDGISKTSSGGGGGAGVVVTLKDTLVLTFPKPKANVNHSEDAESKNSNNGNGKQTTRPASSTPSIRIKGLRFQSSSSSGSSEPCLWVLAGVKMKEQGSFFSSGASQYAVELRRYTFASSASSAPALLVQQLPPPPPPPPSPPVVPHPSDAPVLARNSVDVALATSNTSVLDALLSFRNHVDARMDRIEGMLMMQSQRLSRLETVATATK